ncbi:hypothetical protein ABPG75_006639 [Micractinium tetrahymenae]
MADPSEAVANFVAITGADEATALQMLEATGYQLEGAVNLFFATGEAGGAGGAGGPGAAPLPAMEDDEALARRLQEEATGGGGGGGGGPPALMDEEQVRAPLPVVTERLYGDEPYRPPSRRPANPVPQNVVDAFRNFRDEAGGASGSGGGLAAMFEPPRGMLFQGSFEDAKAAAQEKERWLIVNLQSTSQFASHRLNRDTWRNDMVQSLVENNFVLFQAYDQVEEAQKLMHFYKVFELPTILIIDPVTGAPMRQWTGYVDAERLTEELLPFMELSINDPGASRLARRNRSRRELGGASRQSSVPMSEEDELQRALEMSMAEAGGAAAGGGRGGRAPSAGGSGVYSSGAGTDMEEEEAAEEEEEGAAAAGGGGGAAAPPAKSAAEVQAEAAGRLPQEPADGSGCRIAVRLPDGKRGQRRFPASAAVSALYDFCLSQSEEAAAGRAFTLAQAFPGAPALEDREQTLEAAGLNGAMLVLKWKD